MIATTWTHRGRVCHGLGTAAWALVALVSMACAPAVGWERETARICAAGSPAVICVQAVPDRGVMFELGGTALVPGECARAPEGGGAVRVAWREADGSTHARRLRAPSRRRTELVLGADGALAVTSTTKCDSSMAPFEPLR